MAQKRRKRMLIPKNSCHPFHICDYVHRADVERLIGQGAVRTVKKPTQMKKRLLSAQPPMFFCKEDFKEMVDQAVHEDDHETAIRDQTISSEKYIMDDEDSETEYDYRTTTHQNYTDSVKINSTSNDVIYDAAGDDKQSDITYLMMNNCPVNMDTRKFEQYRYNKDKRIYI